MLMLIGHHMWQQLGLCSKCPELDRIGEGDHQLCSPGRKAGGGDGGADWACLGGCVGPRIRLIAGVAQIAAKAQS